MIGEATPGAGVVARPARGRAPLGIVGGARALLLLLLVPSVAVPAAASDACVVAAIASGATPPTDQLRALPEVSYWIEADRELLLCARSGGASGRDLAARVAAAGAAVLSLPDPVRPDRLRFWRGGSRAHPAPPGRVLAAGGRWAVVELSGESTGASRDERKGPGPDRVADSLAPFVPDQVLARRLARSTTGPTESAAGLTDPQIAALLSGLDAPRWSSDLATLAGWNRWTRGSQILAAREWLRIAFASLPGMTSVTASFPVGASTGWNVIATLRGATHPDDWYVVGGHYDSTSENTAVAAPGAEDNASGCAGVLELARLFAAHPPAATMVFVCFSGEEQGLYGSYDFVDDLAATGDLAKVRGALIFDMIGYTADLELDCLLETDPVGQTWQHELAQAATDFTSLAVVESLGAWGSDHVPFLDANLPAVLAIENDWDLYPHYHRTTDLPGQITPQMGLQILRMGAAALARRAGLNAIFADGFESGSAAQWSAAAR